MFLAQAQRRVLRCSVAADRALFLARVAHTHPRAPTRPFFLAGVASESWLGRTCPAALGSTNCYRARGPRIRCSESGGPRRGGQAWTSCSCVMFTRCSNCIIRFGSCCSLDCSERWSATLVRSSRPALLQRFRAGMNRWEQFGRGHFRARGCARAAGRCPAVSCRGNAPPLLSLLRMYAAPPTSHTRVSPRAWPSPASLPDPTEHRRASRITRALPNIPVRVSSSTGPMAGGSRARHGPRPPSHPAFIPLTRYEMIAWIAVRSRCGYALAMA